MQSPHQAHTQTVDVQGERLELDPLCAVWWPSERTLIISDVHVGKAGHYAVNGIPVPMRAFQENCWNLAILYDRYAPETVVFLGDLYHSKRNREWDVFADFQANYPDVRAVLVKGNHEFMDDAQYTSQGLEVVTTWDRGPFRLVHEPVDGPQAKYILCGHIHPAVTLRGAGSEHMRLPCYWFGKYQAVLPAFGSMTGTHRVRPVKGDQVFVSTGKKVVGV